MSASAFNSNSSSSSTPSAEPKRICQVIELKAAHMEAYKRIHADVWPAVLAALRRAHITDYSIHFLPSPPYPSPSPSPTAPADPADPADPTPHEPIAGLLIATFKYTGSDFEADMRKVGEDEATRRWWGVTDGMQRSLGEGATGSGGEGGEWWVGCEEVFRFEG